MKGKIATAALLALLCAASAGAQQFDVEPDTLEKSGYLDSLTIFYNIIRNQWDQQNLILWEKVEDVPEGWTVEVCQLSLIHI